MHSVVLFLLHTFKLIRHREKGFIIPVLWYEQSPVNALGLPTYVSTVASTKEQNRVQLSIGSETPRLADFPFRIILLL